ncbi:MAG: hypothetical protein R6U22_08195 [Desulfohalobiaceae bacterium]|jgi:hypothetical protein
MTEITNYLEIISRETSKSEAEIMSMAVHVGLRQLWRERILGRYLEGELNREQAIKSVGIDMVELAERQHQAMMEDLSWAMDN